MNEDLEMDILAEKAIRLLTKVLFLAGVFTSLAIIVIKLLNNF